MISGKGELEGEINVKINNANMMYSLVILFITKKKVSQNTEIKVYNIVFIPTQLYVAEPWVLSDKLCIINKLF